MPFSDNTPATPIFCFKANSLSRNHESCPSECKLPSFHFVKGKLIPLLQTKDYPFQKVNAMSHSYSDQLHVPSPFGTSVRTSHLRNSESVYAYGLLLPSVREVLSTITHKSRLSIKREPPKPLPLKRCEQHSRLPSCHTMTCLHTERCERAWWHRGGCLLHCGSDNVTRQLPFSGKFERPRSCCKMINLKIDELSGACRY
jgi:hypothetical protein